MNLPPATNQRCLNMKSVSKAVVFIPLSLSMPLVPAPAKSCCLSLPSFSSVFGEGRASGKRKRNTAQPAICLVSSSCFAHSSLVGKEKVCLSGDTAPPHSLVTAACAASKPHNSWFKENFPLPCVCQIKKNS